MVVENYADMNLDELGSSLLQKKSERERQAAKSARKNERVQKALALLLMGQGIMKSQYAKRAKELEELHKFELLNNESQARDYMINSRLISPMAEWAEETKDLGGNVEDRLKSFKNSDQYIRFENNVRPVLEKNVQEALFKDDYESMYGTPELYNGISSGVDDYARHFLENNRYKTYEDELRQVLNEKDLDAKKLFDLSQGLTKHDVDKYEKATYKKLLNDARAEANIVSGLKKVLNKFGANFKDSGGFDLFQKVDENMLAGPTVKDVSQAINLRGITLRVTDNILETVRKTPERFASQINLPQNANLKKKIADFESGPLSSFKNLIEEDRYPSELGSSTHINSNNIDDMLNHLEKNVAQKNSFVESVGALNLRLLKDRKFLNDVYDKTEGAKDDGIDRATFQKILSNETNRIHFSTMLVMNAGFEPTLFEKSLESVKTPLNPFGQLAVSGIYNLFEDRQYDSFGTLDKVYNNFKVASAIGEGVNVTDKVEVSDSFVNAPKEQKQKMLEDEVERIIADPVLDNTRKQVMLSQLSPVIQQVTKMSTSDFFENLAEKRNKINVKSPIQAGVEVGENIADTAKGIVDRFNRARTSAVDAGAQAGANIAGALRQTGGAFVESGLDLRESSKNLLNSIAESFRSGATNISEITNTAAKNKLERDRAVIESKIAGGRALADSAQVFYTDMSNFIANATEDLKEDASAFTSKLGDALTKTGKGFNKSTRDLVNDIKKFFTIGNKEKSLLTPESELRASTTTAQDLKNILPQNILTFAKYKIGNTIFKGKGKDIDVASFGKEQKDVLKTAMQNAVKEGRTFIKYSDYPNMANGKKVEDFYKGARAERDILDLVVESFTDPVFEMFTTTGVFNFEPLENNKFRIKPDKYDFDKSKSTKKQRENPQDSYSKLVFASQDISDSQTYNFFIKGVI